MADNEARRKRAWTPMAATLPMMIALMVVLPSALNLPQTPPQQTLEFAPVPPSDEEPPPPDSGNVSSLGLGSSPTGPAGGTGPGGDTTMTPPPPPPTPPPGGAGSRPLTKRCVGSPPRQTEDPMSPPCVGYFEGDNGGVTAPGVTNNEVVILVYVEYLPFSAALACSQEGCDSDTYYDLGKSPEDQPYNEEEAYWPHIWRVWQRYFADRYQTYGRTPHVWVHFGSQDNSPEARIADVADAAATLDPFVVIADVSTNGEAYAQEWARRGRTVFMAKTSAFEEVGFDQAFFQAYPGHLWDYNASMQQMADNYVSFLCTQVVGKPVSFAGDGTNGQPRKFGIVRNTDPTWQSRIDYAALVRAGLESCGADVVSEVFHDNDRGVYGSSTLADAAASATEMHNAKVTTVVYLAKGPSNPGYSQAIAAQVPTWRPEILLQQDNDDANRSYEDRGVFQYARNFSLWPRAARGGDRPCEGAFLEASPGDYDYLTAFAVCTTYNSARMVFTGVQVAGPRLTVESLDVGMHAIPAIASGDPRVPACFYVPGDYTCVKDAQIQLWDAVGTTDQDGQPGCWVSVGGGRRSLAGSWPAQNVAPDRAPSDTCNVNY